MITWPCFHESHHKHSQHGHMSSWELLLCTFKVVARPFGCNHHVSSQINNHGLSPIPPCGRTTMSHVILPFEQFVIVQRWSHKVITPKPFLFGLYLPLKFVLWLAKTHHGGHAHETRPHILTCEQRHHLCHCPSIQFAIKVQAYRPLFCCSTHLQLHNDEQTQLIELGVLRLGSLHQTWVWLRWKSNERMIRAGLDGYVGRCERRWWQLKVDGMDIGWVNIWPKGEVVNFACQFGY
jgi:hypothetical protein